MKTIGVVIKEARIKKKLSRDKLEKLTKIKKNFIEYIEEERWNDLPDYPVVVGFVKSISSAIGVNEKNLVALLRRDYPPKVIPVNPKPDISEKFKWSPITTFWLGLVLVILLVASYLIFQYISFIKPPDLQVDKPIEGEIVLTNTVRVEGKVESDVVVVVNNQPVLVDENGNFGTEIEVFEGTKEVVVVARSRSGKESIIRRRIEVRSK